jgi:FtsP/CotA-like multicopper oxidase with cupredoxin domain
MDPLSETGSDDGARASRAAAAGTLALAALLPVAAPAAPQAETGGSAAEGAPWFCGGDVGAATVPAAEAPSRDLYCVELLPTPRGGDAAGVAQLAPARSPFGAPLARDGRFRYRLSLLLDGLPEPSDLGPYRTWVAWAAAPNLRPMIRLGEVGEGLHRLETVELSKFLVLVTAERSADVETRRGPVVLRAQSPSMRLQPHELPFGFMRGGDGAAQGDEPTEGEGTGETGHGGEAEGGRRAADRRDGSPAWIAPPMHPEVPMVPPLRTLVPPTGAFLPGGDGAAGGPAPGRRDGRGTARARGGGGPGPSELPEARRPEVARLEDGDTLRLAAQRVRHSLGDRTYVMYGYNGQLPGPLLRVPQGAEITVVFENRIGQPSTVHWHGIRLENRFDGAPGVTQELVDPGETFVYRVRFPDAGIYWYHPHHREDVQQDLGLYGNMLVEPRPGDAGPAPSLEGRAASSLRDRPAGEAYTYGGHFEPVDREEVLLLDDLLVASGDGPGPLVPYGSGATTHALMGRFGNLVLVNGRPDHRLRVDQGDVVRFYLTNVAGTRTFNLSFGDARAKVVASDLSRYERPVMTPNVVLAPAERYVVEVRFDEPGTVPLVNRVQGLNHVHGYFFQETDTLSVIEVEPAAGDAAADRTGAEDDAGEGDDGERGERPDEGRDPAAAFADLDPNPAVRRDVARYRDAFDRPVDHTLDLTVEADSLPFPVGPLVRKDSVYFHPVEAAGTMARMNWVTTSDQVRWILRDPDTGAENMGIDWSFRVGEVVKIRLRNRRDALHAMQHPIHLHGQRFLVLSRNGRRNDNLVWKDTALVPAGTTATLLLELTNPGEWMVHCHVSEHLGSGMKATFEVEPAGEGDADVYGGAARDGGS